MHGYFVECLKNVENIEQILKWNILKIIDYEIFIFRKKEIEIYMYLEYDMTFHFNYLSL